MTTYRIEFGKVGDTYPVPPITVDFSDPNKAAREVAAHAIPHLTPVLAALGRPELADCFFRTDPADRTYGEFMWLDLAGGKGARFCPARLTPTDLDPDICGDLNDDEVCDRDPGHDGDHCANATVGWANAFAARPAPSV